MRTTQLIQFLILAGSLVVVSAFAADMAAQTSAPETGKLESISPATAEVKDDDCPMHKGDKQKCDHKQGGESAAKHHKDCPAHKDAKEMKRHHDGEPCPYEKEGEHHGKSHKKCNHKPQE